MRVLFITKGEKTLASTRYRVLNLLPLLEAESIETEWINSSQLSITGVRAIDRGIFGMEVLRRSREYDLVYIQKLIFPEKFFRLLKVAYGAVIYDFDDALYTSYPGETSRNETQVRRLVSSLETASAVVTGSSVLTEYAEQYATEVYCLPTSLPREPYEQHHRECSNNSTNDNDQTTLGWIGNPENLWYLREIESAVEMVLNRFDHVRLIIITAGDKPVKPLGNHNNVTYRRWSLEEEIDLLSRADIGIRPLVDDEWTRGKGGFTSVVQSLALGMPVVVTPVGMLSDIVEHGENGFHARDERGWVEYLGQLIEDSELRKRMGKKAYETIGEQRFWADQRAADLRAVLQKVASEESEEVGQEAIGWNQ